MDSTAPGPMNGFQPKLARILQSVIIRIVTIYAAQGVGREAEGACIGALVAHVVRPILHQYVR